MHLRAANKAFRTRIGDLAGSGATSEADLKATTAIRKEEDAHIGASEKSLWKSSLARVINIIAWEMNTGLFSYEKCVSASKS